MIGHIKVAVVNLRHNRVRAYLTMFGIVIGVSSVIIIVAIGNGVKHQLQVQSGALGNNVLTIQPRQATSFTGVIGGGLSDVDSQAVAKVPTITATVPFAVVSGTVDTHDVSNGQATVVAAGSQVDKVFGSFIEYGSFYNLSDTNAAVAVIGQNVAAQLFKESVPLGQSFTFRGQQFIVQGVLHNFPTTPLSPTASLNDTIIIPYDTAKQITHDSLSAYQILAVTAQPSSSTVVNDVTKAMQQAHGGQNDFSVSSPGTGNVANNQIVDLLTKAIAAIAAISLFVAGVGIMNVMLVSVTERMHEVGIRKAVGATNRQIWSQFMTEATLLSIFGCLAGVAIAYIFVAGCRVFTNWQPMISWQIVAISFAATLIVALLFGTAPAVKAARKDPISALRSE